VVRNMSRAERQRLLELVPDLRETPTSPLTLPKDPAIVDQLRQELLAALDGRPLTPEVSFLDNLTLGDYLDLPATERARLWDRWATDAGVSWEAFQCDAAATHSAL
jgi:hypothetical protein